MKQLQWQSEQHQAQQEAVRIQNRVYRKALIGSTFGFDPKSKHTNTEQADLFRTKARYIYLFFANGKADSTKDFNSKDKHGTEDYSNKNINDKNEHSGKDFNSQDSNNDKINFRRKQ